MIYYIDENTENRNTAGSKAPSDIADICKQMGFTALMMPSIRMINHPTVRKIEEAIKLTVFWEKVQKEINSEDTIVYQHPTLGKPIAYKYLKKLIECNNCSIITVIHDLELLRGGIKGQIKINRDAIDEFETYIMQHSNRIISHNQCMSDYLQSIGVGREKIVNLELFDYLHGSKRVKHEKSETPSIAIAGNLSPQKSGYIYNLCKNTNDELEVNLYGKYFQNTEDKNLKYQGSFKPEELGAVMQGDFGLVWDGPSIETCEGNTGEYLRYNNPHKASMYISAGIPIITWSKAAISSFVLDNNIGLVVENLENLQERIKNITTAEYAIMCKNVVNIQNKVEEGYFFKKAISNATKGIVE